MRGGVGPDRVGPGTLLSASLASGWRQGSGRELASAPFSLSLLSLSLFFFSPPLSLPPRSHAHM
jgi:hypothetical protein